MDSLDKFKLKRLIKKLDSAKGSGTSVVTLLLPPGTQIHKETQKLTDELGTADNVKSRVNRQAIVSAISSALIRLKQYNFCPKNGLALFAGEVVDDIGRIKKVTIDFEPFKPLQTSLYRCDDKFHTDALKGLLTDDDTYGFVIIDGNGLLLASVSGNNKIINLKYEADLPKKHNKGGQSAQRFGRIYQEKRQNYITKACECITQVFITNSLPNIKGLIIAGNAELKHKLVDSATFDQRLKPSIIGIVDIAYGGENGLTEAMHNSSDILNKVPLIKESKLLEKYYDEINRDTGKYIFGLKETVEALEAGLIEELIIWTDYEGVRRTMKDNSIVYLDKPKVSEYLSEEPVIDWISENIGKFGANLNVVSNRTAEGNQFVVGFGGIGGILRYKIQNNTYEEPIINQKEDEEKSNNYNEEFDFM